MAMKMASNATLGDVMPSLHDPMSYLLRIKPKLEQCKQRHGSAQLRIGRRGSGQYPCFRIVYDEAGEEKVFGSFVDSGKPVPSKNEASVRWSAGVASYDSFHDLLKGLQTSAVL